MMPSIAGPGSRREKAEASMAAASRRMPAKWLTSRGAADLRASGSAPTRAASAPEASSSLGSRPRR